jgi:hypothetical protein
MMDFWIEAEEGTRLDVSSPFRCGRDGSDVFVKEFSLCLIVSQNSDIIMRNFDLIGDG